MKWFPKMTAGILALCALCALTGCEGQDLPASSQVSEVSAESEPVLEAESLTEEKARALVTERLPLDFEGTYTLTLNDAAREWNGRTYFHFLIENEQITFETSVLVDEENGQIFTYYPDGSAYAPEDDPFCQAGGAEEEQGQSEGESDETVLSWAGSYVSESGVTLSIELQDTSSFEFTLVDPNGNGYEYQVARSTGSGTAESTTIEDATITFRKDGENILVEAEGSLPPGFAPDGTYAPAE